MDPAQTAGAAELLVSAIGQLEYDGDANPFAHLDDRTDFVARIEPLIPVARGGDAEAANAAADTIVQLAGAHAVTRSWMRHFATFGISADTVRGYEPLAGNPPVMFGQRYTCPIGHDHPWYRFSASAPIPLCPDHHVPLELDPA